MLGANLVDGMLEYLVNLFMRFDGFLSDGGVWENALFRCECCLT